MIRLTLRPGREVSVRRRHPWLFSGAVARTEGDGSDGHAEILDSNGRSLARGAYSPDSQIVARLWTFHSHSHSHGDSRIPDASLFRERFLSARKLREQILPAGTTGYRAINSEGDGCPGVLLDIYGESAVLELTTAGTESWRSELETAAREIFAPGRLLVRESGAAHDSRSRSELRAPGSDIVSFLENGLNFVADLGAGQKTGFFLDQRDNRARLRALARGKSVLNLFSYSGAFSVAALAGGASAAIDVDSSAAALALARENRQANGLPAPEEEFVEADVFDELRRRVAAREQYDVVVCDPPAFAKKRSDVDGAARGYKDVNRLAMSLVASEGWLLTCSCSGLVDADLFQKIVFSASVDARAAFALAARQGAGADHPVSLDCPEGEYLKGLWLRRLQ